LSQRFCVLFWPTPLILSSSNQKGLIEKNVMENTKEYFGDLIARAKAKEPEIIRARQDRLVKLNLRAKNRLPTINTTGLISSLLHV